MMVSNLSVSRWRPGKATQSLSLDEHECRTIFPGLFDDIDNTVAMGPFDLQPRRGIVQGKIKDGEVRVTGHVQIDVELDIDTLLAFHIRPRTRHYHGSEHTRGLAYQTILSSLG